MIKETQNEFYKIIGTLLKGKLDKKNLTISQVARREGVQYNTVDAVISGRPFHFHQMIWIADYVGCTVDKLIERTTTQILKGSLYGEESKEGNTPKEETIKEESGASSFF